MIKIKIKRQDTSTKWGRLFTNQDLYNDYLTAISGMDGKPTDTDVKKLRVSRTTYPNGEVMVWK